MFKTFFKMFLREHRKTPGRPDEECGKIKRKIIVIKSRNKRILSSFELQCFNLAVSNLKTSLQRDAFGLVGIRWRPTARRESSWWSVFVSAQHHRHYGRFRKTFAISSHFGKEIFRVEHLQGRASSGAKIFREKHQSKDTMCRSSLLP